MKQNGSFVKKLPTPGLERQGLAFRMRQRTCLCHSEQWPRSRPLS